MRKFFLLVLLCFMCGVTTNGFANIQDPPEPAAIPPPQGLPIDTGLTVLLIAGVTLGIIFLKIRKSKSTL